MDSPQRRSGIPIPKSKFSIKKNKSKSIDNLLGDHSFDSNGDLDAFTLLEENISLKEKIEAISKEKYSVIAKNVELERAVSALTQQVNESKAQEIRLAAQIKNLNNNWQNEKNDATIKQNVQQQQNRTINELLQRIHQQEQHYAELMKTAKQAKNKLEEFAPDIATSKNDASARCEIVTAEIVDQFINEIAKIKTQLSNTELQLYEANEKMAEIMENQNGLRDENESLKVENSNLTKVAKLMTNSMKESVNTSKRMEDALVGMKKKYDELIHGNTDSADGPTVIKISSTDDEVVQLKDELQKREAAHAERIIEMNKLMENAIETNTNDELNMLRVKLDVIEKELQLAIERAERAEAELEQFKFNRISIHNKCHLCGCNVALSMATNTTEILRPPPPPPPLPNFQFHNTNQNADAVSLSDGIAAFTLNNAREGDSKQTKNATGMDALIAELRDGSVTLRRNRRKTIKNEALQEMFEILEISRNQNRNSRMIVECHKNY